MTTVAVGNQASSTPKQNWVLSPAGDVVFIIGAPVLSFVWAAVTLERLGTAAVWGIFSVFNVAHHLPTFIRIYGDKELLRRFRWSLLLAPIVPFSGAMVLFAVLILNDYPLTNIFILFIILQIWDPWHFLMQHYGFMRIYDRHNRAPRRLSSWMDYMVCATWFVFIMVAVLEWLPQLLYELKVKHGLPLLYLFDSGVYPLVQNLALAVALASSVVYGGYLAWCYRRGYFISPAKLLLLLITYSVMYFTYVPNAAMDYFLPEWTAQLGFATLGMVHVTQYLAIVWKYNRGLAARENRARAGGFEKAFARGGLLVLGGYVLACLIYGVLLTNHIRPFASFGFTSQQEYKTAMKFLIATLVSAGFTSTLLHYYYDGFIWKVRHKENRENLAMTEGTTTADQQARSWWDRGRFATALTTILWQCLYFAVPMLLLVCSYWLVQQKNLVRPLTQAFAVTKLQTAGPTDESNVQAKAAIAAMENQLQIERKMIEIRPLAKHYAYLAELTYAKSRTESKLTLDLEPARFADVSDKHRHEVLKAIAALQQALAHRGPYGHPEHQNLDRKWIEDTLLRWKLEIGNQRRSP